VWTAPRRSARGHAHRVAQQSPRTFERPPGIETLRGVLALGLLPTPDCRRTRLEVFAASTAPTREDDYYLRLGATRLAEPCDGRVYAFVPFEAIPVGP
jgi:hypothetical protein